MIKTVTNMHIVRTEMKGDPNIIMQECMATCAALLKEFQKEALEKGADPAVIEGNLKVMLSMIQKEVLGDAADTCEGQNYMTS